MEYKSHDIKFTKVPVWLKVFAILIFTAILLWSVVLVRDKLLKNSRDMGMYLAQSYAWEEENRIDMYSMLLFMCSEYTNDKIDEDVTYDEIALFLKDYSEKAKMTIDYSIIDPYAIIDGRIVAANPWEGDASYEYERTEWYQKALNADGQIIYTNIYQDAITGKNMVTLAVKLHGENNVLAFDIIIDNFHVHQNRAVMSEESSYLLYGADDKIIYYTGAISEYKDEDRVNQYIKDIVNQIRSGEMLAHDATVVDLNGHSRTVYYYEMSNGWLSVITVPVSEILQDDWNDALVGLAMICVLIIGGIIMIMIRSYVVNQKVVYAADTLKFLGDSYYEIYRVNYKTGFYKAVKVPEDMQDKQQYAENYNQLISIIKSNMQDDITNQIDYDFGIENIQRMISNGVFEFQKEYKRKFGNIYKWITAQMIYKQALQINEVVICFKEIDEQKKRQLSQNTLLKNALETAEKNAEQKTIFFSRVSHDMRTPLSAIIGLAKLAQAKKDDRQKVDEYVCKIQTAGEQMLSLVNNVLEFSRIEYDKQSLNYAPIDICQCIKSSLDLFSSQISENKKVLSVKYDVSHPYVYGDAIKLSQIMNNLISNAIKYTSENGNIYVSVKEIEFYENHAKYQIVIEDNGLGMTDEVKKNAFEPFVGRNAFSENNCENGLGLPIVKMLVSQIKGKISLESSVSKGSKFTITLPMKIADRVLYEKNNISNNEKINLMKGKCVLLAEDNEIDANDIIEKLKSWGIDVLYAENGQKAIEIYNEEYKAIDIILIDLKMPIIDGFTAANIIRKSSMENGKNIPIIAVTANVFDDDINRMSTCGISTYISKPIDSLQLKQIIANYINRTNQ